MPGRFCAWLCAVLVPVIAWSAAAQEAPVALFADSIAYESGNQTLIATGNVEVVYNDTRLYADSVSYDARTETLSAVGPLRLEDDEGTVLLADLAELSPDLTEGLIRGARVLLDDRFQIAAAEGRRTEGGRFNTLYRTVGSSCEVCAENPVPIWQIRAERIIQDTDARQIYFENATFDLFGLPVFYVPNLRIPDPSVDRATGFLIPTFSNSDIYGYGVKVPYYIVLGDHADATVTPFVTTEGAAILEGEYRRNLSRGSIQLDGAFALDDGIDGDTGRGFISTLGTFQLNRGYTADVAINLVSDDAFLRQFNYSDDDRLESEASISRFRERDFTQFRLQGFQSLRDDEDNDETPFVLPDIEHRRVWTNAPIGGRLGVDVSALGLVRTDGRDVLRLGAGVDWRRDWTLPSGLQIATIGDISAQVYQVDNDSAFTEDAVSRITPTAGVEFRLPLSRESSRTLHVIEPIAQILYTAERSDEDIPNEDSLLPELDETNLFSLNRFPGEDIYESGLRANLGVTYTRYDPRGWNLGVTLGQVLRWEENEQFASGTGLFGRRSDTVAAVTFNFPPNISVIGRALLDDSFDFRRSELELDYSDDRLQFTGGFVYIEADDSNLILGPIPEANEFSLATGYNINDNWQIDAEWRYDLAEKTNILAKGGLIYGNECIELDLSVSRRFTTSNDVPPSTDIGLTVRLAGFGGTTDRRPADRCSRRYR